MIRVGSVEIPGWFAMSPMAGISDSPTRTMARRFGSAFSYTEFVSTDNLAVGSKKAISLLRFREEERPVSFQIFGNTLEIIVEAAKRIRELNPDIIDLNMGCPTKNVSMRGSGVGLLRKPIYAGKIIEALRKSLDIPVTAKIRLGWDDTSRNYMEVSRILEESGVQAISVHGRTKEMGYSGKADWDAIADIKAARNVPIFGNGDVISYSDALHKKNTYGVDGVLIGRNSIGNPWVFSGIDRQNIDVSESVSVSLMHLSLMVETFGEKFGIILFRKHLIRYFQGKENFIPIRVELLKEENFERIKSLLLTLDSSFSKTCVA
ncbi:dihydrouridine synthase [Leptospira inadai serovar Lyme str. 10]|uniref:tRNA-dihydrouridine synthase n=2 Tax=Leptospira inadai serovar Lyme TaxID=293084 RepID=V6HAB1_9LEPT|nr:tRNA-dihydrouridine synthase family protein [Leptospira inadai]EQA35283.1 dihydrouridine synthase [Leptospira inadai serovar Lyme str. 10]PNV75307.1 tRNA dihydrouridine synthase DusB [Leptospira inadai serovar Lyme]